MSHLAVHLFGPPRIELDGHAVEVDTRKAVALLAYLAVAGRPQSRDVLATLLWEEYDQTAARAALRRTLSTLKTALAGEFLAIDREIVSLPAHPDVDVDVMRFREIVAAVRAHEHGAVPCTTCLKGLEAAVTLAADDFMAGFALRDSESFEGWQLAQGNELRRDLAMVLDEMARWHAEMGQIGPAVGAARRRLGLDPLHEPAHQQLMRLYHQAGQRSSALQQYRECVAILDRELAVPPLEETTRLYEAIKENRQPAPGVPPAPPSQGERSPEYPLIGRGEEMAILLDAYRAVGADGQVFVLEGEAGVGKTRLAEEFVRRVRSDGGKSLTARCYEGESNLAYAPFLDVLRAAVHGLDQSGALDRLPAVYLAEIARLLPDLGALRPDLSAPPPLDTRLAQSRFLDGVCEVMLAALDGKRPGGLVVEDLQWADHASLDLLSALLRRVRGTPLYLLLTWRPEHVPPGHWLRRRLADLQRTGLARVIALGRLDRMMVRDLAGVLVGDRPEADVERLADRLYEETEGLPLFLHAYLAALGSAEIAAEWYVPGTVRDLFHARLAAVSEIGRQILSTGAVIGHSFDFETVAGAGGRDEELVIAALEELIAAGLIVEIDADGVTPVYDFTHEKLRSLVYEETSLARRRLLHRRVAETLVQRRGGRPGDAGKIAAHYRQAGDDRRAAEYYQQAGDEARALYANHEALRHYETALALGRDDATAIHTAIGDIQTVLGEYADAIRRYETAAARADSRALARIEHRLGVVYQGSGEWERADAHLRAALAALPGEEDGGEAAPIYADRSLVAHHRGCYEEAQRLAERSLALAAASGDRRALAQAHNILGILANARGDQRGAREHLEESLSLAARLEDGPMRAAAMNNLALAARQEGHWERARALAEEALALSEAQGDRHREAALHNNLADLLHVSGREEDAIAHVKAAVTIYAEIGVEAGAVRPEIWKLTEW